MSSEDGRNALSSRDHGQWLQIQVNTFKNWVNESLKPRGIVIEDVRTDLSNGVKLVALVEALTRQKIPTAVSKPSNQYEKLQNITVALDALRKDGVKLVNIDSSDIQAGDLKLVLALVWQLVTKYQVGTSVTHQKAWILKWLQAVIPECNISNFSTDWNDGVALHALLEFCKEDLCPNWSLLDRENGLGNCQSAMKLARKTFNIPLVLQPEHMASESLDEKSCLTYLSYFTRVGGPGYEATLRRVMPRIHPLDVTNFTTDWKDGRALVNLVASAGGDVNVTSGDPDSPLQLVQSALDAGQSIGAEPLQSAEEIVSDSTDHLGMMTYSAQYIAYPNLIPYTSFDRTIIVENHNSSTNHKPKGDIILTPSNHQNGNSIHVSSPSYLVNKPLKVTTSFNDDDASSAHTSTFTSKSSNAPPTNFHLVRRSSVHAPRVEVPTHDQLKVDIYSVGVIMESKMSGMFDPEKFRVEAVAPSGRVIKVHGDGQYAAHFNADEIGRWKVSMFYDNRYLDGCPVDVCDPSQVKIRDLQGGNVGKPNTFHVDCSNAGRGDLGVDITFKDRPVVTHISPTSTQGIHKVTFTPYAPGPYEINVHFNRAEVREGDHGFFDPGDRQRKAVFSTRVEPQEGHVEVKASCDWEVDYITGRPFICHVTDSTDISVYGMEDGTVCAHPELIADCSRVGDGRIDAEVTHNGMRLPCKVKRDQPCVYRISFKPKGPGIYKVWVNYDGRPVKGSPFIQEIAQLENPSANGDGLYKGVLGKPAKFTVDPRGFPGQVSVAVDGPSRPVSCELEPQPDNTIKATYHPTERGPHKVQVKLDGRDIEGSPYNALIVDPVSVRLSGGLKPYLDEKGVIPLKVNKEKHLPFDVSESGPGELTAEVEGPNGKVPVTIDARKDGKHSVIFTPREEGKHHIHVNWGGYPLSNSPFLGYATHEPEMEEPNPNIRLVHVPLQYPDSGTHFRYPSNRSSVVGSVFDGPFVSIRGSEPDYYRSPNEDFPDYPTKVQAVPLSSPRYLEPNYVVSNSPNYLSPTYVPKSPAQSPREPDKIVMVNSPTVYRQPQDYVDAPSPNTLSPKSIMGSSPASPEAPQKVILSGKGLKEAEVDTLAQFYVDGTQAKPGRPHPYLQGVKDQIPVNTEPVSPQVYKCTYVPKKPGAYLLYADWNDKPLRGSPFKVSVRQPARPDQVITVVEPQHAVIGKPWEMKIDPRPAGPGQLTAKCTDPQGNDMPCHLNDNLDGTKSLKVTPRMPGRHILEIRYNDEHIMGSPYAIDIKDSNAKGTVKVWGPGIEDGVIPNFQSTFWVETTGAGAGDLRVRIMGPKGAFHVKMRKASQKEKIYQCFYDPVEPGMYSVHVQWSGVHVDGSPFSVLLAGSVQDLLAMQNNNVFNGNNDRESVMRKRRSHRSSKSSSGGSVAGQPLRVSNRSNPHDILY